MVGIYRKTAGMQPLIGLSLLPPLNQLTPPNKVKMERENVLPKKNLQPFHTGLSGLKELLKEKFN